MLDVTDKDFAEKVLQSDKPVLIDFHAQWCGPCKMMTPALDALDKKLGDKVTIVKVDIDQAKKTAQQYGVRGVPTFAIVKGGQIVSQKVGAMAGSALENWVKPFAA